MKGISSIILSSINLLNILCCNIDLAQGIQNGMLPEEGQFAYQVAIFINGEYACGGAALNRGNVLSAGSCVLDEEGNFLDVKFEVVAGVINFHRHLRKIQVVYVFVKYHFRPPSGVSSSNRRSFPRTLEKEDLSVLKLAINIPSDVYITFVGLPETSLKFHSKEPNIAGFGRTDSYAYVSSSNLTNLPHRRSTDGHLTYIKTCVIKITRCQNQFPAFHDDHICTRTQGSNPTGACLGDVGSPLVFENMAIGVLQIYAANCDERVIPAIYTRTSSFIPFIKNARDGTILSDMRIGNYTAAHVREEPNPYMTG